MGSPEKGNIFDIQRCSMVDGPGVRTTIFFKGCNLRCKWCHNPEGLMPQQQMMFYKENCKHCGKCKQVCPYNLENCDFCGRCVLFCPHDARKICGKEYAAEEVFEQIRSDKAYYENTGGGVTFSGGECMLQAGFLLELLKKCTEAKIHTAIDTAGNVPWESFEQILPYTDLFLYDLKCYSEDLHREYTGVSNQRILNNLYKLAEIPDIRIVIRIPLIPGVNDQKEELFQMADFIRSLKSKPGIELLPYHQLGISKYRALGMKDTEFRVPSENEIRECKKILVNHTGRPL